MMYLQFLIYLLFPLLGASIELAQSVKSRESNVWMQLEAASHGKNFSFGHNINGSVYLNSSEHGSTKLPFCTRNTSTCINLRGFNLTCLGTELPYSATTFDLTSDYIPTDLIKIRMKEIEVLRYIPKCWAIVQALLCSLYMPNCIGNLIINMPSQETCRLVLGPCRAVLNHPLWPSFINCEDLERFPLGCRHNTMHIKFNNSGSCLKPLIPTDNIRAMSEDIDGCGYPCINPVYSKEEHQQMHSFIAWAAGTCLFFNSFTVLTFMVDWRSSNKYPALVIFYINGCFMVSCIGWLLQFRPGSRELTICGTDGTLRRAEPNGGDLSCVMVFVLVYYSLVAAMVWFVILTYTWHMSFQALHKMQDKIDKKAAYFHLMAWCIPLVLTVAIIALGEIDGNSITGICFVGYFNHSVRVAFLLIPLILAMLIGGFYLLRGLLTLIRLKMGSEDIISEHASSKIRETIIRIGLFSVFSFATAFVTIYCHIYEIYHSGEWNQSFRNYVICLITSQDTDVSVCKIETRQSLAKIQLHLLSHFFAGILMSSWVWTGSAVDNWVRFFRRILNHEVEEDKKRKKHKVIAQAFAKRNTYNNDGRLSINFCSSHEDPVGLNFELNSVASQALSSTWAAALPKLVARRGAIIDKLYSSGSISSYRRNSVDSEVINFRRVSVESRRNSLDSQISVKIEELQTTRKVASSRSRNKRRKEFRNARSRKGTFFRRGSSTSQESQLGAHQIMNALTNGYVPNGPAIQVPNMNRRPALSTYELPRMDGKSAGKLLPFLLPSASGSEDDLSSEGKNENELKSIDMRAANPPNDDQESDNDSHIDEETKMLEASEEPQERSRSKGSNREGRRSKYMIQDETIKQLLQESVIKVETETETKYNSRKGGIGDLASDLAADLPPYYQERSQTVGSASWKAALTQTSVPLDILEMEELKQSIDEIISNRKKV